MNVTNTAIGHIISDHGVDWEVIAVYPHYVRARRVWNEGEEHNCEQYKCFDIGLLVTYGYEDGGDPRTADTEKEERHGKPRC